MTKEQWEQEAKSVVDGYLERKDGHFDDTMCAHYHSCDYEEQSIAIEFTTQAWQRNERDDIHGGAIAGMFDTAFGVVANLTAGENEATTTDMTVSFLRGVEYGMELELTVYIVKAGRSLIRQRAELVDAATGKLLATASGSWMPL